MTKKFLTLLDNAKQKIKTALHLKDLFKIQSNLIGKNSFLQEQIQQLKNLKPGNEKKQLGFLINKTKGNILKLLNEKRVFLEEQEARKKLKKTQLDISLDGPKTTIGQLHPLTKITQDIEQFFIYLGYQIINGNELEQENYNFEKLNIDQNHPARLNHDSFYIDKTKLLRTHCTNMTARLLEKTTKENANLAFLSTGTVYRRDDDDATHSHQFSQIDGFLITKDCSFAKLKWTLEHLIKWLFGPKAKVKLRPSYFPFTEPSVEVDLKCTYCSGKGCHICKHTGYIEVLGAGLIHENVFKACNKDQNWKGFAFGIGVDRLAMLKYNIDDIRSFYLNDLNFLKAFK